MHDKTPIPKRLKEARQKLGLSQKELGIRIGIDQFSASPRINHYEKGRHLPDYFTVERLAETLGVPVPYFYAQDDNTARLILLWGQMSEAKQASLLSQFENREQ